MFDIKAPMSANLVLLNVQPGQEVRAGELLLVLEAMKMEHELTAPADGRVAEIFFAPGEAVRDGEALMRLESVSKKAPLTPPQHGSPNGSGDDSPGGTQVGPHTLPCGSRQDAASGPALSDAKGGTPAAAPPTQDPGTRVTDANRADSADSADRADFEAWQARLALTRDAARPEAMAKRHALGLRSARQNVDDLCVSGSFVEYGALAFAAQTQRRDVNDLRAQTPADGIICGIGRVRGVGGPDIESVVMAYDATVLAGTQGMRNHQKTDRMLEIAMRRQLPVVLFAEGGGGRPGDTDMPIVAGLHVPTFANFARLAGQVPLIGIAAGRCFAGNAALLACCDLVIAASGSNIGMGGPAMVEGGGLGVYAPEAIGPAEVQAANGVVDVLVEDEAAAVRVARHYLGLLQPAIQNTWHCADQAVLRTMIPENRLRAYDVRRIVSQLVDSDSMLELRAAYGAPVLTFLARIEGRAVALLASNCAANGGAIDAEAAWKAADWMRRCQSLGLPLISLIDTPGFMVGPESEARGQVRASGQLFRAAAQMSVPIISIVLRRAYGLGAMALAGGSLHSPLASLAWPSGEFGAMGLEGAVRLGYRKELLAQAEGAPRQALFDRLLARQIDNGRAVHMAEMLEIDAVIDPAQTRQTVARLLAPKA